MALSKDLLSILACPDDKAPVKEVTVKKKYALKCTKCKRVYPVRNGIPIMMPKDTFSLHERIKDE